MVLAREEIEADVRRRTDAGDHDGAAAAAIRGYGPEIFEFLVAMHRSESDGSEVFSLFTEGVWRGLARFDWQCSFRTWAYAVARRCSLRYRRDERRRAARAGRLPEGSALSILAERVRTETLSYLKTQKRSRIAALRETLPEEDQTLLMLRVDRKLAWNELVYVLHEEEAGALDETFVKKEAARLRKRFQLVKERLYELGQREGLVGAKGGN